MTELQFVTDGMLGKLTRWLRMLGQDVEYAGSMDDKELIQQALRENRILLTRDLELYRRAIAKGAEAFLIENPDQTANLTKLAQRFKLRLEIDMETSRCPKCNGNIRAVSKDSVASKIHETTSSSYDKFWECQRCGQVYWRGTHWKKIDKILKDARDSIEL